MILQVLYIVVLTISFNHVYGGDMNMINHLHQKIKRQQELRNYQNHDMKELITLFSRFTNPETNLTENIEQLHQLKSSLGLQLTGAFDAQIDMLSRLIFQLPFKTKFLQPGMSPECMSVIPTLSRILPAIPLINADKETSNTNATMQMFDAWAKPGAGILIGDMSWLGSFSECLAIVGSYQNSTDATFRGQYCELSISIPALPVTMAFPLAFGTCVPSVCNASDLEIYFNNSSPIIAEIVKLNYELGCQTEDKHKFKPSSTTIGVIFLLSFIGFLMLLSTTYDVYYNWSKALRKSDEDADEGMPDAFQKSNLFKLLTSFSVYSNGKKILSTEQTSDTLGCLHGMRFFSMAWVVLAHSYMGIISMPIDNFLDGVQMFMKNYSFNAISNGFVSVDTFFYLSGFLVSYLFFKTMEKTKGRFNVFVFYLHRYLRLTPAMGAVIAITATFYFDLSHGPSNFQTAFDMKEACVNNSWTNFLYINNFVHTDHMCLGQSWYLANDMQFFLVAPLILVPLYRWPKIGYGILALAFTASIAVPMAITAHFNLPSSSLIGLMGAGDPNIATESLNYMDEYYYKPYCRFGPYVVGIVVGYIIAKYGTKYKINKICVTVGWLLCTAVSLAVLYGLSTAIHGDRVLTKAENIIYNGLHKQVWGICMGWITFACVTGNGGFVNTILSWKPLIPLSRLTYCTYLIHLNIMYLYDQHLQAPVHFDHFTSVSYFLSFLVMSLFFAMVISLAFEAPFIVLENLLIGVLFNSKPKNSDNQNGHAVPSLEHAIPRIPQKSQSRNTAGLNI